MILTGENYIKSATLASTSGIANQNIENLKIPQLSKNFVMNTNGTITLTGVSTIPCVVIDVGTCSRIQMTVVYNDTHSEQYDLTATSSSFYHFLDKNTGTYKHENITSLTFQFTGLLDGDLSQLLPSIGYIFIGKYLQMPPVNPSAGLYYNTTTQKTNSISGQQFTDKGYQYIETDFSFPRIPETSEVFLGKTIAGRQEILSAWKSTEFQYEWLFPWENSLDKIPPVFGSMKDNSLKFTRSESSLYWSLEFSFREIK